MATKARESCLICQIAASRIPSYKIYEDDSTLAFLDVNGANPGHCFVVPKNHYPIIEQVPEPVTEVVYYKDTNKTKKALKISGGLALATVLGYFVIKE